MSLLGLVTLVLGALSLGALGTLGAAAEPVESASKVSSEPESVGSEAGLLPGILIPDALVTFGENDPTPRDVDGLVADLEAIPSVAFVSVEGSGDVSPRVLVGFVEDFPDGAVPTVEAVVGAQINGDNMAVSGRAPADIDLRSQAHGSALWAVVFASIVAAIAIVWTAGWRYGLLSGLTLVFAGMFGSMVGAQMAGPFDGSIVTTAIPAALGALLVSAWLIVRLLSWFQEPVGDDQAEVIRRSVRSVWVELGLLLATFGIATIVLELAAPGRSAATVIFGGVLTSAAFTLAVVPPLLTVVGPPTFTSPRMRVVPPVDGGGVPVGALLGIGVVLGILGLLALRSTAEATLLDARALADGSPTAAAPEGGDPTNAILVQFPEGTNQASKTAWLQSLSEMPAVGSVDTSLGRYRAGEFAEVEGGTVGPLGPQLEGDEAPGFALVVPTVGARGMAARTLVDSIEASNSTVDATLSGPPVEANQADQRDRSTVLGTIVVVALLAGVAVFVMIGDLILAAMTVGLRILTSAAVVGLAQLLLSSVSGAELQLVVLITGLGIGMFELAYLRRLLDDHRLEPADDLLGSALGREGWVSLAAFTVVALAGLGLVVADFAVVRRFGILLAVGVLIEVVIGCWILRAPILGTRSIVAFASRPVRTALAVLAGHGAGDEADQQRWAVVVSNLTHSEFSLQADPAAADVSAVFVATTPIANKAVEHHASLAEAGLRIVGRPPQLRSAQLVGEGPPATISVIVDHPHRQLVDGTDTVVGVRKAERRSSLLWLRQFSDGSYRIADSVELGSSELGLDEEAAALEVPAPVQPAFD